MNAAAAKYEIRAPRLLHRWSILTLNLYGVLLMLPILAAFVYVSLARLSWWSVGVPLGAVALSMFFLPFGFGNLSLRQWARSIIAPVGGSPPIAVQVRILPPPVVRSTPRKWMEDADDIGLASGQDGLLLFHGDATTIMLPKACVGSVKRRNIGWRGFFVYGGRTIVTVRGVPGLEQLEFAERESLILPQSWSAARRLLRSLRA
jgi:hypothetical protein